ncbi:MAG: hypothetical protein AAF750_06525 [Planctomycetota bacterium]
MPGIDLEQTLKERGAIARRKGTQLIVASGVLMAGVFGLAWGVGWVAAWLATESEVDRLTAAGRAIDGVRGSRWWWPWVSGVVSVGALAGYGLWLGMTGRQENPDAQDGSAFERSTLEQMTGRGQKEVAHAFFFALLLVPGKLLGEGLRMRRERCVLSEQELVWGQRIADDLYAKNDWLPLERYGKALPTVRRLIGAGVVWVREGKGRRIGQVEVRLDPGLMD